MIGEQVACDLIQEAAAVCDPKLAALRCYARVGFLCEIDCLGAIATEPPRQKVHEPHVMLRKQRLQDA